MITGWICNLLLCLVTGITLLIASPRVMLCAESNSVGIHGTVTSIPAQGLIRKPANFFDLEETTVRFTPNGPSGYTVEVGTLTWEDPLAAVTWRNEDGASVELPFAFPYAGRTWTRIYANVNGNISFAVPESSHWPHRDPWADGTMRSIAAAIDSRSASELEAMIAVLWALYEDTTITVDSTPARVAITWEARRATPRNIWYEPLGENLFQARLYPSGIVELAYRSVAERDGIVGLFHGTSALGETLEEVDDEIGEIANAVVDLASIKFVDNGSTVLAKVSVAEEVPERVPDGNLEYRIFLEFGGRTCAVGMGINESGRGGFTWCGPAPRAVGYRVQGATVEIPISKTLFARADHFSWRADAVWWGREGFDHMRGPRSVSVGESDYDLGRMSGSVAGNTFEVFHYPSIQRGADAVMSYVYDLIPANDEIAVPFTDFRADDLWNIGPGSGPINAPVQGIGSWQAAPTSGERYGSDSLLTTMAPLFIGGPNFIEAGSGGDREFRDFGYAIRWIAHEAVHRWAAHMNFRNPQSGRIEPLTDDWCRCHWSEWLHAPAMHAVGPRYSAVPYSEASVMGGSVWLENGDGTFTRAQDGYPLPTGLSALDLYVMGMIPPTQVPDTFLLRDVEQTASRNRVRATKVPVRIDDVVAAMGSRLPSADTSRKEFRLGLYLLHENGRQPRAALLERTQALTMAITEYFARATGGRMRVVPIVPTVDEVAPGVADVGITSVPRDGAAYGVGEDIDAYVRFNRDVLATGGPKLVLSVGTEARMATLRDSSGEYLYFRYTVQAGDSDTNGISILAGALLLSGGNIHGVAGQDAALDLGSHALIDDPEHRVDAG